VWRRSWPVDDREEGPEDMVNDREACPNPRVGGYRSANSPKQHTQSHRQRASEREPPFGL
jgi:hypothetical protein